MAHPKFDLSQLHALSPEERIQLAEDLWDSLAAEPAAVPLTDAQAHELDRRLAAYQQDGAPGTPWQPALARIEDRLQERGG